MSIFVCECEVIGVDRRAVVNIAGVQETALMEFCQIHHLVVGDFYPVDKKSSLALKALEDMVDDAVKLRNETNVDVCEYKVSVPAFISYRLYVGQDLLEKR
jgi:hypothetical protein